MARLVFSAQMSLDGYVADEDGRWDWTIPDDKVHAFINDLNRPIGTHLLGRRMYEVLKAWKTMDAEPGHPPVIYDFAAIWKAADKIVYSRTLDTVETARTGLEREFDPETVQRMKEVAEGDLSIGGPELAGRAFAAGLVDDVQLFLAPVVVGGGTRARPDHVRLDLELVDERRFGNGVVYVHHRSEA
jgi:dihydrofolate reductase